MKCYKLLNKDLTTYSGCKWVVDEWKETSGEGVLCGDGWLHGYEHPLLAVLHNPIHANIEKPVLYEAEADGDIARDGQMKFGATRMRIVGEMTLPIISTEKRVKYAIYCALEALKGNKRKWAGDFCTWARDWLSGKDRSRMAVYAVYAAARAAVAADAAWAAAGAAADAAWAAADAADAAAYAAVAAADAAAVAAADAADYAAGHIDLIRLAKKACGEEKP